MIALHPLNETFSVEFGEPFAEPAESAARIAAIWNVEKDRRGDRLSNGRVYSLLDLRPDRLLIQPAEYRHVLARRRVPELGLTIRPLAVTGLLLCADGLVLGRRGQGVTSDAGLWEPAPAGGLAQPDPVAQVLEEMREEVGLDPARIERVHACGLAEDTESGVVDILFRLHTLATEAEVRAAHTARATDEYAELAIVPPEKIGEFLQENRNRLLPALRPMLTLAGLP